MCLHEILLCPNLGDRYNKEAAIMAMNDNSKYLKVARDHASRNLKLINRLRFSTEKYNSPLIHNSYGFSHIKSFIISFLFSCG